MIIKNIYYSDFETLTKDSKDFKAQGHTDVFLAFLKTNNKEYYFKNLDEYFNFLIYENKQSALIYFHNLSFDGDFIIKYLIRRWPNLFKNNLIFDKKKKRNSDNYFFIFNSGNKIYYIEFLKSIFVNGKRKKIKLIFKCTYNILSSSINNLGKGLGFDKKEEEKELINLGLINTTKEFYNLGGYEMDNQIEYFFKKYIKKDVEIAKISYENFKQSIYENKYLIYSEKFKKNCINIDEQYTIASIVYKLSLNNIYNLYGYDYFKKYKIIGSNYEFYKNWYYGGFTQFNEKYYNKDLENVNIECYDINSSYPFQMTKILPVGELYNKPDSNWNYVVEFYELEVEYAEIKPQYYDFVILKNWKKETTERYVRFLYDFKAYYLKDEWLFIKKIYDVKVKKKKIYYAEGFYILKNFIENLYIYKEQASKEKNESKKWTYKIMLNSLYGVQCKRDKYPSIWYIEKEEYDNLKIKWKKDKNMIYCIGKKEFKILGFKLDKVYNSNLYGVYLLDLKEKKKTNNILIGVVITSYARLQLWNAIYNVGVDNWYYADTDSIFINKIDTINEKIKIDKNELGAWDLESTINKGRILGAKRYYFITTKNNKIKFGFSGVDIEADNFDWDHLFKPDMELIDAQHLVKRDDYGIYFDWRNYKIKGGKL